VEEESGQDEKRQKQVLVVAARETERAARKKGRLKRRSLALRVDLGQS